MNLLWALKDFYWEHRELARALAAISAIAIVNLSLLLWTARRIHELSLIRERINRLADGIALLTDTTEVGMATLIQEVEQLGRRRTTASKPASRASVGKRVLAAVRDGDAITSIAKDEALSESEVRLHLAMATSAEAAETSDAGRSVA
jgi:hypothetical protein